jgi:hypothetical protein
MKARRRPLACDVLEGRVCQSGGLSPVNPVLVNPGIPAWYRQLVQTEIAAYRLPFGGPRLEADERRRR